jgi:Bacterial Ig domain/Subtilase family
MQGSKVANATTIETVAVDDPPPAGPTPAEPSGPAPTPPPATGGESRFKIWSVGLLVGVAAGLMQAPAAPASVESVSLDRAPSGSKLSSVLVTLAQPDTGTASKTERARLSLPAAGPGSLVRQGADVVVDVRARTTSPGQVDALGSAGARVLHVAADLRTVTVAVAPAELKALASVPGVENVSPELEPITAGLGAAVAGSAAACQGAVTSEADTQLRAAEAREAFGVSGAGVEVGVLSDSYDVRTTDGRNAADDVASGDLPGPGNPCVLTAPVDVLADGEAGGTDEGRAMAQLVHDVAPGASLAFATAGPDTAFPARLQALREAGADVMVDDVTWLDEPFFQPGPQAVAVQEARDAGVAYFSSAANLNLRLGGQDRGSWEAPAWRPTTCPDLLAAAQLVACMNFAGPTETARNALPFQVAPGRTLIIDLQWAEPWYGVDTDLDAFLIAGNQVVAAAQSQNPGSNGTQKPVELLGAQNGSAGAVEMSLVIGRYSGPDPSRLKFALIQAGGAVLSVGNTAPEDRLGPTIFGHNVAPGGMSVAAVPFSDSQQIEPFSSRGPVTHYFGPVAGTTPAEPLDQPDTLAKPDIAATDGAATTFFPPPGGTASRFFGTSAAAPHAAAVAALAMEAAPQATLENVYAALRETAAPVGAFPPDAQGAGLVDAYAALEQAMTPVAAEDGYEMDEDTTLTVSGPGVLGNDTDPRSGGITAALVTGPAHGDLALAGDGSFSYAPDADFNGDDSFSYRASNGMQESDPVAVTIDVFPVKDAVFAGDDAYAVDEDATLSVDAPGVLGNDGDPDGDPVAAALVSGPGHGELTLDGAGSFIYTPDPDFNGGDRFVYRAHQGDLEYQEAVATIAVRPVDEPAGPVDGGPIDAGPFVAPPAAVTPHAPVATVPAISDLRLASRCVRRSGSGRVRVAMSIRLARPGAVQVRIARAAGGTRARRCPGPGWARRNTLRYRRVVTVRRVPAQAAGRVTLNPRLAAGLYRITVRAHVEGNRLSPPVSDFMRVLG